MKLTLHDFLPTTGLKCTKEEASDQWRPFKGCVTFRQLEVPPVKTSRRTNSTPMIPSCAAFPRRTIRLTGILARPLRGKSTQEDLFPIFLLQSFQTALIYLGKILYKKKLISAGYHDHLQPGSRKCFAQRAPLPEAFWSAVGCHFYHLYPATRTLVSKATQRTLPKKTLQMWYFSGHSPNSVAQLELMIIPRSSWSKHCWEIKDYCDHTLVMLIFIWHHHRVWSCFFSFKHPLWNSCSKTILSPLARFGVSPWLQGKLEVFDPSLQVLLQVQLEGNSVWLGGYTNQVRVKM